MPDTVLYDVKSAAEFLQLTPARVRQLRACGDLVGVKIGNAWAFPAKAIETYRRRRKGRPPLLTLKKILVSERGNDSPDFNKE